MVLAAVVDGVSRFMEVVFGGDAPHQDIHVLQVVARTVVLLLIGLWLLRVGKSRLMTGMTSVDAIGGFLVGSVLSRGMTGSGRMSHTVVALTTIIFMHWLMTGAARKWRVAGRLVKGGTYELIVDGVIQEDRLAHCHVSMNDLMEQMRLGAGTDDPQEIRLATKERGGQISFIRKKS